MKIGILGFGNVGGTLGRRWASKGHAVVFGVRRTEDAELQAAIEEGARAGHQLRAASMAEAAANSEVIVLATPWGAVQEVLRNVGPLPGKILVDATNPLLPGLSGLEVGRDSSAGELVAAWRPEAKVVKCFNTVGYNIMADPKFAGGPADMLYCGDDKEAKTLVAALAEELDFRPVDAGPLRQARLLEPFALLWISMAMQYGYGREIGFQLLQR